MLLKSLCSKATVTNDLTLRFNCNTMKVNCTNDRLYIETLKGQLLQKHMCYNRPRRYSSHFKVLVAHTLIFLFSRVVLAIPSADVFELIPMTHCQQTCVSL